MTIITLGVVLACLSLVLAESTAAPSNEITNLTVADIKLKLREFMNYSTMDSTNFQDYEADHQYYRCGLKGIKAFSATPHFTSSKYRSVCRRVTNLEFDNYKNKCGISNWEMTATPWLVSVMIRNINGDNMPLYRATGTIIHPNLILVPQEPFEPFSDHKLMIRSNGQTQNLVIDNTNTQTREVVKSVTENFTSVKYLALRKSLLVLAQPILFNEYAHSICLPDSDDQYETENCFVLGWNRSNELLKFRTNLIECTNFEHLHGTRVPKEFFVCTSQNIVEPFRKQANYCRQNQICDFSTVLVCPAVRQHNFFYQVGVGYMVANNMGYFLSTFASKLWIDKTVYDLQFKSQYYTRDNNNEPQST